MKLTKNFSKSEFECSCGCEMPNHVLDNVYELARQLQIVRDYVGMPITINSGYRCEYYNDEIGKASKKSQHKKGKAADIVISDVNPHWTYQLLEEMIKEKRIRQGGLGKYDTFTHYDIRSKKVRW